MWRQGVKLRDDPPHFFAAGRVHLDLQFLRIIDEARVALVIGVAGALPASSRYATIMITG
jgi:hypothetical protein